MRSRRRAFSRTLQSAHRGRIRPAHCGTRCATRSGRSSASQVRRHVRRGAGRRIAGGAAIALTEGVGEVHESRTGTRRWIRGRPAPGPPSICAVGLVVWSTVSPNREQRRRPVTEGAGKAPARDRRNCQCCGLIRSVAEVTVREEPGIPPPAPPRACTEPRIVTMGREERRATHANTLDDLSPFRQLLSPRVFRPSSLRRSS